MTERPKHYFSNTRCGFALGFLYGCDVLMIFATATHESSSMGVTKSKAGFVGLLVGACGFEPLPPTVAILRVV